MTTKTKKNQDILFYFWMTFFPLLKWRVEGKWILQIQGHAKLDNIFSSISCLVRQQLRPGEGSFTGKTGLTHRVWKGSINGLLILVTGMSLCYPFIYFHRWHTLMDLSLITQIFCQKISLSYPWNFCSLGYPFHLLASWQNPRIWGNPDMKAEVEH